MSSVVYTIGHSVHTWESFQPLLAANGVDTLVDVRSRPASRHAPFANKRRLQAHLEDAGIRYIFLGEKLGARPLNKEMYDRGGKPDFGRIGSTPEFSEGIDDLVPVVEGSAVAIMCAEEDPANCHRNVLVAPRLLERGIEIRHIRKDGSVEGRLL